jgi:hypothetical protein
MTDGARLSNGKFFPIKQTNADKIRQMTDEELAEWLENHCYQYGWLNWLKQEAETE